MKKTLLLILLLPLIASAEIDTGNRNCKYCDQEATEFCEGLGCGYVGYCTRRRQNFNLYATCGRGTSENCTQEYWVKRCIC